MDQGEAESQAEFTFKMRVHTDAERHTEIACWIAINKAAMVQLMPYTTASMWSMRCLMV